MHISNITLEVNDYYVCNSTSSNTSCATIYYILLCCTVLYSTVQYSTFCVCVLPYHIPCSCHWKVCVTLYDARCVLLYVDLAFLKLSVHALKDIDRTSDKFVDTCVVDSVTLTFIAPNNASIFIFQSQCKLKRIYLHMNCYRTSSPKGQANTPKSKILHRSSFESSWLYLMCSSIKINTLHLNILPRSWLI